MPCARRGASSDTGLPIDALYGAAFFRNRIDSLSYWLPGRIGVQRRVGRTIGVVIPGPIKYRQTRIKVNAGKLVRVALIIVNNFVWNVSLLKGVHQKPFRTSRRPFAVVPIDDSVAGTGAGNVKS